MSVDFLRDNLLLFGPGFLFAKLVYLFGEQHRRLEWEWLIWSLLAGLPIALSAEWLATGSWPAAVPSAGDPAQALLRFAIAIVSAIAVAAIWRSVRHWSVWPLPFIRRSLSDSAWDLVLDAAHSQGCGVAVTVERTDDQGRRRETSFYGWLAAFGYEAASAEPIVFLKDVWRWDATAHQYVRLPGDEAGLDGMVFHRDKILRLRLYPPRSQQTPRHRIRMWWSRNRSRPWAWLLTRVRELREAGGSTGTLGGDGSS